MTAIGFALLLVFLIIIWICRFIEDRTCADVSAVGAISVVGAAVGFLMVAIGTGFWLWRVMP